MTRRTLSEVRDVRVLAPSVTMTVGGGLVLDLREEGSVLFLFLHQDGSLTSMHRCMCMCMCGCVCVGVCMCGGRGKGVGCSLYTCVFVMVVCVCVCVCGFLKYLLKVTIDCEYSI